MLSYLLLKTTCVLKECTEPTYLTCLLALRAHVPYLHAYLRAYLRPFVRAFIFSTCSHIKQSKFLRTPFLTEQLRRLLLVKLQINEHKLMT